MAFISVAGVLSAGCVLLDLCLPDVSGLQVQARLNEIGAPHAVVLLTGFGDVPDAVAAMRAGALNFLRKPFAPAELEAALADAQKSIEERKAADDRADRFAILKTLTPRETDVLAGLAAGKQSKIIAYDLGLSIRTVEMYRGNILKKLGVPTTGAALLLAQAGGLVGSGLA
jgi:two-component system response regulator FixJ